MTKPPGPRPADLTLGPAEQQALETLINRHTTPQQLALRARIVLAAASGLNNGQIARRVEVTPTTARMWRERWREQQRVPLEERSAAERLTDQPRPGAPPRITPEQWCQLVALVCEAPADSDRPISQWSSREIAAEAIQRGLVDRISPRHVGRFLKGERPAAAPVPLLAEPASHRTGGGAGGEDPSLRHRLPRGADPSGGRGTDGQHR